jgi:hypothetical protein
VDISENWLIDCNLDPDNPACSDLCLYSLAGDLDNSCNVDIDDITIMAGLWTQSYTLVDFAFIAQNWLIDCDATPANPACQLK